MNPFGVQIVAGGADDDHRLCRCQRMVDVRLVVVTCHTVQRYLAEKDVVFSGKLIIYLITEIGIVRSGILEADKDLATMWVFFFYFTVFFFVFFNQ